MAVAFVQMQAWCMCGDKEIVIEKNIPKKHSTNYYQCDGEGHIFEGNKKMGRGRQVYEKELKAIFKKHVEAALAEVTKLEMQPAKICHEY